MSKPYYNCPECAGHGSYEKNDSCSAVDYWEPSKIVRCSYCNGKGKISDEKMENWKRNR